MGLKGYQMLKRVIQKFCKIFGFKISRIVSIKAIKKESVIDPHSMEAALCAFFRLQIDISTVIDIGAAQGSWSILVKKYCPRSNFVLFEPLVERRHELMKLVAENRKFHFIPKAAGKNMSKVSFVISSDLDGSGVTFGDENPNTRTMEVTSVDYEVGRLKLGGPFIVKLDTHGFEPQILEGCINILGDVELFIIECYGFEILQGSLLFWELCKKMDDMGFRVFNVVDLMNRPSDLAFWQCDIFFIKKGNLLFKKNQYV